MTTDETKRVLNRMADEREYVRHDISAMTEDSLRRWTEKLKRLKDDKIHFARDIRDMLDTDTQGHSAPYTSPYIEALHRLSNRLR